MEVKFEPKQFIIEGTMIICDKNGKVVDEYEQKFAYEWNELGEIVELIESE